MIMVFGDGLEFNFQLNKIKLNSQDFILDGK